MNEKGILLESGTNELEVLEFKVENRWYGINVLKVREVLNRQKVTSLPESHPSVDGILKIRDEIITQVNLIKYLGERETENDKIIITEFNERKLAFRVSDVSKIQRVSWRDIEELDELSSSDVPVIGIVKFEDKLVLILDFEKIVETILPTKREIDYNKLKVLANAKIAVADDSNFILEMINDFLHKGGYKEIRSFHHGQEALDYLQENPKEIDVLISDIEMPKMDGLTLCKKIKENKETSHILVMLYSSLITDSLKHKGRAVGADFQVNKPQFRTILQRLSQLEEERGHTKEE